MDEISKLESAQQNLLSSITQEMYKMQSSKELLKSLSYHSFEIFSHNSTKTYEGDDFLENEELNPEIKPETELVSASKMGDANSRTPSRNSQKNCDKMIGIFQVTPPESLIDLFTFFIAYLFMDVYLKLIWVLLF